jgi:hypothetical protein
MNLNTDMETIGNKPFPSEPIEISWQAALDKIDMLESKVAELEAENSTFKRVLDVHGDRGHDDLRKRLAKLESGRNAILSETAEEYLNTLFNEMRRSKMKQVTFKTAGNILGVSTRHARRLQSAIEDDDRFEVAKDNFHKQRKVIQIRSFRM